MRNDERRVLDEVWNEYAALRSILATLAEPPAGVVRNLEPTYLVRLYARFEGLIRDRLALPVHDDSTLVNCIQRLSGENVGYDPANDGRALAW